MNTYELPPPRPPRWALETGLPAPTPGEGFERYWRRVGVDVDAALHGLSGTRLACAEHRVAAQLMLKTPSTFRKWLSAEMYRRQATHHPI